MDLMSHNIRSQGFLLVVYCLWMMELHRHYSSNLKVSLVPHFVVVSLALHFPHLEEVSLVLHFPHLEEMELVLHFLAFLLMLEPQV